MKQKLSLSRETLRNLQYEEEMRNYVGGTGPTLNCPTRSCPPPNPTGKECPPPPPPSHDYFGGRCLHYYWMFGVMTAVTEPRTIVHRDCI